MRTVSVICGRQLTDVWIATRPVCKKLQSQQVLFIENLKVGTKMRCVSVRYN
jgi:hypothetical protein